MSALTLSDVTHRYGSTGRPALSDLDLVVQPGETVALTGASGSGKSTLLAVAGLLLRPTAGQVYIAAADTSGRTEDARTALRREHIGFLFQEARLVRHLTVLENIVLPLLATSSRVDTGPARDLLDRVGLVEFADRRPGTLSGGQAQRVAFCRALVARPALVLADEPTSALDADLTSVLSDLLESAADEGVAVVVATHDPLLMAWASRIVHLDDGRVVTTPGDQTSVAAPSNTEPMSGAGK